MARRKKHRRKATAAERRAESKREKGKLHPHKGHKESAKTRAKLRRKLKGRKVSNATRAKLAKRMRGRHLSKATRAKLARRMRGRKLSKAERAKISKALKGRKHPHKGHKTGVRPRPRLDRRPRRTRAPHLRHRTPHFAAFHPRHVLAGGLLSQRPDRAAPRRRRNR